LGVATQKRLVRLNSLALTADDHFMVRSSDFRLSTVQILAVTPNADDFDASALLVTVLNGFRDRYNGPPQVIPLPPEVPAELPRVVLTSQDQAWTFTAGPKQMASSWKSLNSEIESLETIAAKCVEPIGKYINDQSTAVGRIGFVVARYCQAPEPAQQLVSRFCNDELKDPWSKNAPFRNSRDFQIHNLKQYKCSLNLTINSWVRCKAGTQVSGDTPVIVVEQDINTLSEEMDGRALSAQQVQGFLEMACQEMTSILNLYFPS
jgi:hypothetical protein